MCERGIDLDSKTILSFLFLENSNLKIYSFSKNTFIKGKLLFFNQLPTFSLFCPLSKGMHA